MFISEDGMFKLGDFGVARTVERTTGGLSKKGTYNYMAPEVYKGEAYGKTVDIYSLGMVLYWLLNRRRGPFLPLSKSTVVQEEEAKYRRFAGEPLPYPADGSRALKEIVLKACAFDSKDRYASPSEMLDALNDLNIEDSFFAEERTCESDNLVQEKVEACVCYSSGDETIGIFRTKKTETVTTLPVEDTVSDERDEVVQPQMQEILSEDQPEQPPKNKKKIIGIFSASVAVLLLLLMVLFGTNRDNKKEADKSMDSSTDHVATFNTEESEMKNEEKTGYDRFSVNWKTFTGDGALAIKEDGTLLFGNTKLSHEDFAGWSELVSVDGYKGHYYVGLHADGTVVTHTDSENVQESGACNVESWKDIVDVRSMTEGGGKPYTLGLKKDGTVICTRDLSALKEWENVEAIAASQTFCAGLCSDGTVLFSSCFDDGQANCYESMREEVESWTNIVSIESCGWMDNGTTAIVGLKSDGTVKIAGAGVPQVYDKMIEALNWKNIVAISGGYGHIVGLCADGTVVAAGSNAFGECDVSEWKNVVAINAQGQCTVGMCADGTLIFAGRLDSGTEKTHWTGIRTPELPEGLNNKVSE